MLEINVAQLLKSPIGETRRYDIKEMAECENGSYPVAGEVNFTRTNRGILVKGTMKTQTELNCSRCLRSFNCPLTLKLEDEYFPTIDIITGNPAPAPEDPGAFTISGQHILDLTDAVCQYATMTIPMKPLCREDCAGLCPQCGKDLNKKPCGCVPSEIDLRWAKLRELQATISTKGKKKKTSKK